ncbi:MAG: glycosyltransferase family 4 protein, partial [Acidimicrobiales bacterium]
MSDGSSLRDAPLTGTLDEPVDGAAVDPGHLVVRGWHAWLGAPALAVAVEVLGETVVVPVGGDLRTDVGETLGDPALARSGWRAVIDLTAGGVAGIRAASSRGDGEVAVVVTVWGAPGATPVRLDPRHVRLSDSSRTEMSPSVLGALDSPRPGELLGRGHVQLTGWALGGSGPVERVQVLVDGVHRGLCSLGLPRPDLAAHFSSPAALIAGFAYLLDLTALPPTTREIGIVVRASARGGASADLADLRCELSPTPDGALGLSSRADVQQEHNWLPSTLSKLDDGRGRGEALSLVVFAHDLNYGGAQLWLSELLRRAGAGSRFDCTVVSPAGGPLVGELTSRGVEVHVTQDYPVLLDQSYEGRVTELSLFLESRGVNAALVNTFLPAAGADAAARLGVPFVWAIHESIPPPALWPSYFPRSENGQDDAVAAQARAYDRLVGRAGALVFVAESTRRLYDESAGADRSVVIRYGIDTEAVSRYSERVSRAEARRSLDLRGDTRVVLMVGTTAPRKAQTVVAEAFAELADEMPDVVLVFLGALEGDYLDGLRAFLSRSRLEDRARVLAPIADPSPWYRAAHLLICASDSESLPRTVLEAMAFGLPVLATRVFGLPELLTDGVTGYLYEPCDLGATVAALRRVLTRDPSELADVAEAGRRLIFQSYDSAGYSSEVMA